MNDDRDLCPACLAVHNYLHLGDNKVPTRTHDQGAEGLDEDEIEWPPCRHCGHAGDEHGASQIAHDAMPWAVESFPECRVDGCECAGYCYCACDQCVALSAQPPAPDSAYVQRDEDLLEEGYRQGWDAHIEHLAKEPPAPAGEALERMAEAVHQAYLDTCVRLGWEVKPSNLVPYAELSDDSKELDRASVRAVLAALSAQPPAPSGEALREALEAIRDSKHGTQHCELAAIARAALDGGSL